MNTHPPYVLGLHPSSRGFGWILFEGPLSPFDWGAVEVRGNKNALALGRIEKLLDKYQPGVLVLEDFEDEGAQRSGRIRDLCCGVLRLAAARRIPVCLYTRDRIRTAFAGSRARTREEIAAAIAGQVEPLRPRLPKRRKIWVGEHPSIALFCAAACALAYYAAEHA